jgi:hypothetical protein
VKRRCELRRRNLGGRLADVGGHVAFAQPASARRRVTGSRLTSASISLEAALRRNVVVESKTDAGALRVEQNRLWQAREQLAQLWQDLREVGSPGTDVRAKRVGLGLPHVRAQRLDPRPVGRHAAGFPAAPD